MTISTLTTEDVQELYESAVHEEATGSDEAGFVLSCKLDDAGGTGAVIRKLIDIVRARDVELLAVREAQSKPADLYLCRVTRGGEELYSPCGKDYPRGRGYFTAPPAPAVTVNFKALAKDLVDNLVDCGAADDEVVKQYRSFAEKTCRAAMLKGEKK
ncbi:TPA: hypothetical protein ACSTLU_004400 [Serratia fonticola]